MEANKPKHINILLAATGIVVIFLWLIKIWHVSDPSSLVVLPLEILSMLMILAVFYYFFVVLRINNKEINKLTVQLSELKAKHEQRESKLLQKIMYLEEKEKEKEIFNVQKQKTIARIAAKIDITSLESFKSSLVNAMASVIESVTAIGYWYNETTQSYEAHKTYGIDPLLEIAPFAPNIGFAGQAVAEKKLLSLDDVPEDYFSAESGLGSHRPKYIYFAPIILNGHAEGLLEIGSFKKLELSNLWSDLNHKIEEIYKSLN
jgi:hypothetical protein